MNRFVSTALAVFAALVSATSFDAHAQRRGAARTKTPASATKPAAKPSPTPAAATRNAATPTQGTPSLPLVPVSSIADVCGCESSPLPEVLASVNGTPITKNDLTEQTRRQVGELQSSVIEARKRELNLIVNSRLLEAEAKKRGTTGVKLLEQEVVGKAATPTEAEARAFFDQNKARIQEAAGQQSGKPAAVVEFAEVRERIVGYLREQRQSEEAGKFAERLRAAAQVKVLGEATPPASDADRARVLATVNGAPVTSGDVEDNLRPLIFEVQERVFQLRKHDVDLKINDILLEAEARSKSVTARAILDAEVGAKIPTVTPAQAQAFYDTNKARINGDFAQVRDQIIKHLQEEEERKIQNAFAQRLRNSASVQSFLAAPEPPVYRIATDDQPSKGSPSATVTVVEFTDLQCPSCAATHPTLERLMTEYADRVRFVVRDYPLEMHADAFKAAEAAEAAREQGKYWDYVAVLFKNQSKLGVANLKDYATVLGLDRQKFDAALDTGRFADKVRRDIQDGNRVGVSATPTLFVNGRRVPGVSYEALKATIESALKAAPQK